MVTEHKVPLTKSQESLDGQVGNYGYSYHRQMRDTAILQITSGVVLALMGFLALYFLAWWSYFATPIWSGILIFLVAGSIGVSATNYYYYSYSLVRGFVSMSLIGAVVAGNIVGIYIYAATQENNAGHDYNGTHYDVCQPGGPSSYITHCDVPPNVRQAVDVVIAMIGLFLFITCLCSTTFGFYALRYSMTARFQQMKTSGKDTFVVASPNGSLRLLTGAMDMKGESGMQMLREAIMVYCLPVKGAHSLPAAAPPYSLPSDDAKAPLAPSTTDPQA